MEQISPCLQKSPYLSGSIASVMIRTAICMLPGTIALSGYSFADTYFISKLGTCPLAAMGFVFPVTMLFMSLFKGLSIGIQIAAAQLIGENKRQEAARLISSGLFLMTVFCILLGFVGYCTMNPVFKILGAQGETLELVRQYMIVTYWGLPCMGLVMSTNDLMIATGTRRSSSSLMVISLVLNIILDPILISGLTLPFQLEIPAFGIAGAAWATIIAQSVAIIAALFILGFHSKMLTFQFLTGNFLGKNSLTIARLAIPSMISMLLIPIGNAVVTKATSYFGDKAVAACAAAGRIEILAFIITMALGMSLMPMIAQNFGACQFTRIHQCRRFALRFAFVFLMLISVFFFLFADFIASFFSDDPEVCRIIVQYLQIVSWGFGMIEVHRFGTFFLLGCNHPKSAAMLNGFRILICLIPLTMLASCFHWLTGLFIARLLADWISGYAGWFFSKKETDKLYKQSSSETGTAIFKPNTESSDFFGNTDKIKQL